MVWPLYAPVTKAILWASKRSISLPRVEWMVVRNCRGGDPRGSSPLTALITALFRTDSSALLRRLAARETSVAHPTVPSGAPHSALKRSVCFKAYDSELEQYQGRSRYLCWWLAMANPQLNSHSTVACRSNRQQTNRLLRPSSTFAPGMLVVVGGSSLLHCLEHHEHMIGRHLRE